MARADGNLLVHVVFLRLAISETFGTYSFTSTPKYIMSMILRNPGAKSNIDFS